MSHPAYPAARAAAKAIYPYYARLVSGKAELLPSPQAIEAILDVAFWTSLRREEIYTPRLSLAFAAPAHVNRPLVFERFVPLASHALGRLAPAVERPGIHLCVWSGGESELCVWGASGSLPEFCFVVDVIAPGLLVIKDSRGESGKFINVAVLEGEEIKVVDRRAATTPDCPELLTSLLGVSSQLHLPASVNVLIQLAVSMREHGRGGSLLVVPADSQAWRHSIMQPVMYAIAPAFRSLVDLLEEDPAERTRPRWKEALNRVILEIGGLTAVDGATIMSDRYELLAFGAKIVRRPAWKQVDRVLLTEPIEGTIAQSAEPTQLGGTRHLSAAQFAHDQRDAMALVASQDGRFTAFAWSVCHEMVHAHRIETLLL